MELRPYQLEAIDAFFACLDQGKTRQMIVLSTGAGKTVTALALALRTKGPVLWLTHRDELIRQPLETLSVIDPDACKDSGIVKADKNDWEARFVFASIQSAVQPKRLDLLASRTWSLVVADECHLAAAPSWRTVIEAVGCSSGTPLLGLTATPERSDQTALSDIFDGICYQYHLETAIEAGYLCPPRIKQVPIDVDLDDVHTVAGDFHQGELDIKLLEAGIVNQVADAYEAEGEDRKAIVFALGVNQARLIAEELCRRGHAAVMACGETPTDERRRILQQFKSSAVKILCNAMLYIEGFDEPSVGCIVMARPTKSKTLMIQAIGRGLRTHFGKQDCIIVDMVGTTKRHSLIQAPTIFGLGYVEKPIKKDVEPLPSLEDPYLARLKSQARGLYALRRSRFQWVTRERGGYALPTMSGTVVLREASEDQFWVEVLGGPTGDRVSLSSVPVSGSLAQGIAEDYVRRLSDIVAKANAPWRDKPATAKQIAALKRSGIAAEGLTCGQASDLISSKVSSSRGFDPATPKQIGYLRRLGAPIRENLSKREAGKLISQYGKRG